MNKIQNYLFVIGYWLLALNSVFSKDIPKGFIKQLENSENLFDNGDYQRSAKLFASLLKDYPQTGFSDELRFRLAESYFNMKDYLSARNEFLKILKQAKYSYIESEVLYGITISSIMLQDYQTAEMNLNQLSKKGGYDKDKRANFAWGVLYYFKKDYKQAVVKLLETENLEAKFFLAKSYAQTGEIREALLAFNEIISQVLNTPLATLAQFASAEALFINKDFDGARAKFKFFLENFPNSPLSDYAHYLLGCALIDSRKYDLALEHLKPLTKHSSYFLAAHANYFVGYCYLGLNEAQNAVSYFQKARANYPKTKVSQYANLQLLYAILATHDTLQVLIATSQLSQMFTVGDLSGVGDYFSGVINYQTGEYEKAGLYFEKIIVNQPNSSLREPACALLLLSLNSNSDYEGTVTTGAKYINDFPLAETLKLTNSQLLSWRAKLLYFLAEGYYYLKKYPEAEIHYYESAKFGTDIALYARLGRAYALFHLGRLDEAETEFKELLGARRDDSLFTIADLLGYGYTLFNQNEYQKALDVFEATAKEFPNEPKVAEPGLFYAGLSYYLLQFYGQAVDSWLALINRFPLTSKAAEGAFRTGDTYFKAREYEKAISTFRFVVEKHPNSPYAPTAQALIAQAFYNQKRYLETVKEYLKFLDLYPNDEQAQSVRKSLEMSYYQAGLENPSVMSEFLTRFPGSELVAEAQFSHARVLFDSGAYERAVHEFQLIVVNFPNSEISGDAQLLTAESYANLKWWKEASEAYKKFLNYFPQHPQRPGVYYNLATVQFNLGEYENALKGFQVVVDSFPNSEFFANSKQNVERCQKKMGMRQ